MGGNPRRKALGFALGLALVICLPLPVDSKSSAKAEETSEESVLRLGFVERIDSLNPYIGRNDVSKLFHSLVYDTLTCVGNDLETVPNLARSQRAIEDGFDADPKLVGMPYGSVWQFNLSPNAYWTNGEQFTADDVVYNIEMYCPLPILDFSWAYTSYSYYIRDAWKTDNHTVRISFWDRATLEPMPVAHAYSLPMLMLPKRLIEQLPGGYPSVHYNWTGVFSDSISPGMPIVGTGPFMVTADIYSEWATGDSITLVRNPNCHWAADYGKQIKFDRLILRFFDDITSMVLALQENDIDAAAFPRTTYDFIKDDVASGALENVTTFDGRKLPQYFTYVGFCMNAEGPNPSRLDPIIRQALHKAMNKTTIVDDMYLGYAEEGKTLIPPVNACWHYEPTVNESLDYNLEDAKSMLEAAGYTDTDGNGFRDCTIGSTAVKMGWAGEGNELAYQMLVRKEFPEERAIAEYLKSQWEKIGVLLNYSVFEELTLSQIAYSYKYDTIIWSSSSDLDPTNILFIQSRYGWSGWSDNKYYSSYFDENYTNSVKSMDEAQRKAYVDNCERIHYNDSAYIILAYPYATYALRNDTFSGWGDWQAHPGRSLDNHWTGNPLVFDLEAIEPLDDTSPDNESLLAKYWWVALFTAIVVVAVAGLIHLSRKRTT